MICVIEGFIIYRSEFCLLGSLKLDAIIIEFPAKSTVLGLPPHTVEIGHPSALSETAKRMNIALAKRSPIFKRNSEFKRRFCFPHKLSFINAEKAMKRLMRGNRSLTYANCANAV